MICACYQSSPKESHLNIVKNAFLDILKAPLILSL